MNVIGHRDAAAEGSTGVALLERTVGSVEVWCEWCGLRTSPAPACERCGSPLSGFDAPAMSELEPAAGTPIAFLDPPYHGRAARTLFGAEATAPSQRPDPSVIRSMIGRALCPWCSRFSPAGATCAECGSPLPVSSWTTAAPVAEEGSPEADEEDSYIPAGLPR